MTFRMNYIEYLEAITRIKSADHAYYVESEPIMPDAEYDELMKQIREFEQTFPDQKLIDSPTERVGSDLLPGFETYKHVVPCKSLDNIFDMEGLETKLDELDLSYLYPQNPWVVEPKIDGLTVDLEYENGMLVRALTRGDGEKGDVVTANAKTIRSIPLRLNSGRSDNDPFFSPKHIHIRGEVFMTFATFRNLNQKREKEGKELLANPRNAASGAMKLLDPAECARRHLSFIPYHVAYIDAQTPMVTEQDMLMGWFRNMGFETFSTGVSLSFKDKGKLLDFVTEFGLHRREMPYPTDGVVVKVNYLAGREHFGEGTKSVRWAYAFKYQSETANTKLKSITIQVGRTGALTPVAELEPVELSGSTIRRASLHNQDMVESLEIGPGDVVEIVKCGEIIPGVTRVVKKSFRCPECNFIGTLEEQIKHHG